MEITGKIIAVLPVQSGTSSRTGNPWKVQSYVLETLDQYPRKVCFELFGDRADQFPLAMDEVVNVSFDIESREYNGRWFTSIRAWKVDKNAQPQAAPQAAAPQPMAGNVQTFDNAAAASPVDDGSGLPF